LHDKAIVTTKPERCGLGKTDHAWYWPICYVVAGGPYTSTVLARNALHLGQSNAFPF